MNLSDPFPPEKVSWRVGSTTADKKRGMALAYIDARDVMERLDAVAGPHGWQCEYEQLGKITICRLAVKLTNEWIWKSDGAGDTDFEAEKGALSDAFKRAAVKWGIGRYLYDIASPWVAILPAGKSFKIDENEMPKLWTLLSGKPEKLTKPQEKQNSRALEAAKDWAIKKARFKAEMDACKTRNDCWDWGKERNAEINVGPQDWQSEIREYWTKRMDTLKREEVAHLVVHDEAGERPATPEDFDPATGEIKDDPLDLIRA